MSADRDSIVQLFRVACASVMGVTSMDEAGSGEPLSSKPFPFGAYRVGTARRVYDPSSVDLAAMDRPVIIPVTVFYVRKRAGGDESLSAIRQLMDGFADALEGTPPTWGDGSVVWCRVNELGEGSGDEYSEIFHGSDTMAAGHIACEILYCR